jgi:hypothetical protein
MAGDEARVVAAFCEHLRSAGWEVTTEVAQCDVVGVRDGRVIYAEAKGRTASPGLDVDTMFGQLLRRMPNEDDAAARWAVVVPADIVWAVMRVPHRVRQILRVDAYSVDSEGAVVAL